MHLNHYKGVADDSIKATLSAAGFNFGGLPSLFLLLVLGRVFALRFTSFRRLTTK